MIARAEERVVLVDLHDRVIGTEEKMRAHREARLHRAFSVFVFDSAGRLMLQRRAQGKYHSPALWSNTVCSHPRPGESTFDAAHRRLLEEMGFDCPLVFAFDFTYLEDLGDGMYEHELDHVFIGRFDGAAVPDPEEVSGWRMVEPNAVRVEMNMHPESFSIWFRIAFPHLVERGIVPLPQSHQPCRYQRSVHASR
jgi:isopentenyl-diphosphate Delta-isomerase